MTTAEDPAAAVTGAADPTLPGGAPGACALLSASAMAQILGGAVTTISAGDAACVFHTDGDDPNSVEIAELPSAVLPSQLGAGTFTPMEGLGGTAYWSADETLLVVTKGAYELAINASVGDDQAAAQQAAVAVANAALPSL